jgi:epoxyqueuosine reductase
MCPTDAITPWNVDARKCISYLTIEHRNEIEPKYYKKIGKWIFGCDICQEVCPHNQPTQKASLVQKHDAYETIVESLDVQEVIAWDEESRKMAISGTSLKRAKLSMMRRNAVIVAGNILLESQCSELLFKIEQIARNDEDPIVQKSATEVLKLLNNSAS